MLASQQVRRRPVYYKDLGAFLVGQRERRHWQQSEAAAFAQRNGHKALTRQVLLRLENGQTKSPDPEALRAVAAIYKLEYEGLIARMVAERYGVSSDLTRHTGTGHSDSHRQQEESDVPASDRILEERKKRDRALGREMQDALRRLYAIATKLAEESEAAESSPTRSTRRHRKAG